MIQAGQTEDSPSGAGTSGLICRVLKLAGDGWNGQAHAVVPELVTSTAPMPSFTTTVFDPEICVACSLEAMQPLLLSPMMARGSGQDRVSVCVD